MVQLSIFSTFFVVAGVEAFSPRVGTVRFSSVEVNASTNTNEAGPEVDTNKYATFDPFSVHTPQHLLPYREAEVKFARIAIAVVSSWMISEVVSGASGDMIPVISLLGLSEIEEASFSPPPELLGAGIGLPAALELYAEKRSRSGDPDYFPGNLGFDPLHLYPTDKEGQEKMQLAEIELGRGAMLGATALFANQALAFLGLEDPELILEELAP